MPDDDDKTPEAPKAAPTEASTPSARIAAALERAVFQRPAADPKAGAGGDSKLARREAFERAAIDWRKDPIQRARMAKVHEEAAGFRMTDASRLSHAEVVNLLSTMLDKQLNRLGTFKPPPAAEVKPPAPASTVEPEAANAEAEPPPEEEPPPPRDWIEIQFVGMDDKPVSGIKYKVKLPGGKTVEGKTASKGLLSFEDLDSGDAELTIVEFEEKG